ncbi:MAG: threonine synthase [Woeseiaceae bacterium]|nr:threonine synthase [Woeseiaceae bacterium]
MNYRSTRGAPAVSLDTALVRGIADDGGLFLPVGLPQFTGDDFDRAESLQDVASVLLQPLFIGSSLADDLQQIIDETFAFPISVSELQARESNCGVLELFHGPTAAFKDVGARFLAACLSRLEGDTENPLTILVATSGDTGGAVAAAFDGRSGMRVAVLYPDGRVSDRQAHQLTCWSDNVLSLAVNGSFDDCQRMVKAAMADPALTKKHRFSSANSINIGRLLPQSIYYAFTALSHWRRNGRKASFIVPTGNLGNAFACYLARGMGLPIGEIVMATNANRIIVDFLDGEEWAPRSSVPTLATAMDVGNPSNMERLRAHGGEAASLAGQVRGVSVSDEEISAEICRSFEEFGVACCPHTATAIHVWRNFDKTERLEKDWILVATAHAAKFEQIVEPLIGKSIDIPDELAQILSRERRFTNIDATVTALENALAIGFSENAAA